MSDFQPTNAQGAVLTILVNLIGVSGVHKRPEQGEDIILDLLPASHVMLGGEPFCVRVKPDGVMVPITAEEAGLGERPTPMEALMERSRAMNAQLERVLRTDGENMAEKAEGPDWPSDIPPPIA